MIKSKPYRFFTIVMAFVVLFSSTGFGLVEHSCMMRGKSVELAALKKAELGCKMCKSVMTSGVRMSSSLPAFNKKACCEESHKFQKLEIVTSTSSAVKSLKASPVYTALGEHIGSPLRVFAFLLPGAPARSLPPFLPNKYGRGMLSFVQSYLI